MNLENLRSEVQTHTGTFLCERIHMREQTKIVHFTHVVGEPAQGFEVPSIGQLRDFLDIFGSVIFYRDRVTGEAAKHLAPPSQWAELDSDFRDWLEALDDEERAEILPEWADDCLVIGEEPGTGNYILMPVSGNEAGSVYLFDHDGFEFIREADDIIAYVQRMLSPDDLLLTSIASHMRFVEGDPMVQWWIRELEDNRGNSARTTA